MYKALSAHAINVSAHDLDGAIAAAKVGGFQGVEINPAEIARLISQHGLAFVQDKFAHSGIKPAGWGLPTDWRGGEAKWREELQTLPELAKAAAAVGCTRTMTWILPFSDERDMAANRAFHVERFTPIAKILADEGVSFGLEFIGPKTMRVGKKYEFISTLPAMLDMGRDIGPNVGLLLDCWHWYTSHGTLDDLRALTPAQVVYVHVNDAPTGIDIDAQMDSTRALPGETGVIDIAGFLQALQHIGYDGPVTPEPFKKELSDLPSDEARLQQVGAAMNAIFQRAGITPA